MCLYFYEAMVRLYFMKHQCVIIIIMQRVFIFFWSSIGSHSNGVAVLLYSHGAAVF